MPVSFNSPSEANHNPVLPISEAKVIKENIGYVSRLVSTPYICSNFNSNIILILSETRILYKFLGFTISFCKVSFIETLGFRSFKQFH